MTTSANVNKFLNKAAKLNTNDPPTSVSINPVSHLHEAGESIYYAPDGYSAIILMVQVTNVNTAPANATFFWHSDSAASNTELIKNVTIPPGDAINILTGKLILQSNDALYGISSTNNYLKATLSILESLN